MTLTDQIQSALGTEDYLCTCADEGTDYCPGCLARKIARALEAALDSVTIRCVGPEYEAMIDTRIAPEAFVAALKERK